MRVEKQLQSDISYELQKGEVDITEQVSVELQTIFGNSPDARCLVYLKDGDTTIGFWTPDTFDLSDKCYRIVSVTKSIAPPIPTWFKVFRKDTNYCPTCGQGVK